jgi:hypothetical protein
MIKGTPPPPHHPNAGKSLLATVFSRHTRTGVYILENTPEGGISANVIWGKNMKSRREKGGKCKRKRKKGERKRKKGDKK